MTGPSSDTLGRRAETLAAWYLRLKGYQTLNRRYVSPVGEIDLVVRRGGLIVFVEVKLRQGKTTAMAAVTSRQQQRISRAAATYLKFHPDYAQANMRFDVVVFGRWTWPTHIEDAWRPQHF